MAKIQAEIHTPSGKTITIDVESFQLISGGVDILSATGIRYLTSLSNVLLTSGQVVEKPPIRDEETGLLDKTELAQHLVELVQGLKWEFIDDGVGIEGHAVIENTTGMDLSGLTIKVNLLDQKGDPIDTETVYITDWEKGEKRKIQFRTLEGFATYTWWIENFLV